MKKIILILLIIKNFSAVAQITVSGAVPFNGNTFSMYSAPVGTTPAVYRSPLPFNSAIPFWVIKVNPNNNTWAIYQRIEFSNTELLYWQSSTTTGLHPPCNDVWLNNSTYSPLTIAGNTCIQLPVSTVGNSSVTTTVNGVIYPTFTSTQIQTIPNPVVGQTVFDFSKGFLRTWNGTVWVPQ